uniref:Lipocalin n=1 Tax=Rhipicephalus zambeziensis TaxID=60191 RepID=A0A224YN19_9ACAR
MLKRASGVSNAETNRTDQAFKRHNEIIFRYVIDEKLYKETTRILYADYSTCTVLNSTLLGTMLWVKHDLLLKEAQMPYLCTVTYELAARDVRYIVYDWKECPTRKSYKENVKKLTHDKKNNANKDL